MAKYFPKTITESVLPKFSRVQQLAWLEFMGISVAQQPNQKPKALELMREVLERDPERAQAGYAVIVHHELPGDVSRETHKDVEKKFYSMMDQLASSEAFNRMTLTAEAIKKELTAYGKQILLEAADNYRPIKVTSKKGTKKVDGIMPKEFEKILQLANQRRPIMLVGPAGCGKTFLAEKVAEAFDLPYGDQSCSEGVSESQFSGWLIPTGKGGQFIYVSSVFVEIYENGGVFLLDEMDNSDPNLLVFLNKSIANECFFLPQRAEKPRVDKHEDFIVIGAANTYGSGGDSMYVGRNQLDAATLDRFRCGMVMMDYSTEVEVATVDAKVLEWGLKIRAAINEHRLRHILSTRVLQDFTAMLEEGWGEEDWNTAYFADWSEDERIRVAGH